MVDPIAPWRARGRTWAGLAFWSALVLMTLAALWPIAIAPPVSHADKLVHLLAYAVLGTLARFAGLWRPGTGGGLARWLAPFCLGLHGLGIEIAQGFLPPRQTSWADAVANGAGLLLAWLLARHSFRRGG